MQTDSNPYRKLENVLTSRQQVLSMEFFAMVRIGRTVHQAGRHRGRRWVCCRQAGIDLHPYRKHADNQVAGYFTSV
jgi:hypothetical protein